MELCGQLVSHQALGTGEIVDFSNYCVTVVFQDGSRKRFAYPSAFESFLEADNRSFQLQIQQDQRTELKEQVKRDLAKEELAAQARAIAFEVKAQKSHSKGNSRKTEHESNIAFKCNYCDGGKSTAMVGYAGVCSDAVIKHNTSGARRTWCRESPCQQYVDSNISRAELEASYDRQEFVCYESRMLQEWRTYPGLVQNGANKGKPIALRQVMSNSLALLTTRLPSAKDEDRFVFAVFLIDKAGTREEGYVGANPKYRLQLSLEEARELRFWDYYSNPNKPEKIIFGSGLHKYLTDVQAAQVLKKICEIKKGSSQEEFAREFFEQYCRLKNLDVNSIPSPNGPLRKTSVL